MSQVDVQAAVETWVRQVPSQARPDAGIESVEPYEVDGEIYAYIARLSGGGFCLCGADDLVLPVYFYSPRGNFDPQNPGIEYILWEIEARTRAYRQGLRDGDPDLARFRLDLEDRARFWGDLRSGRVPPREEEKDDRAEPFMMLLEMLTHWGQGHPYNQFCPVLTPPDERTYVGCVATAMVQIMNYWQWPPYGTGTVDVTYNYRWRTDWGVESCPTNPNPGVFPGTWRGRLKWSTTNGGQLEMTGYWDSSVYTSADNLSDNGDFQSALSALWGDMTQSSSYHSANLGNATYNWSLMDTVHADPPDPGDTEVAEVSYHAGLAVEMDYGILVSLAGTSITATALESNFFYDTDVYATDDRDIDAMTEDIAFLRPVWFRGSRPDTSGGGGHAWVVHGYDKAGDPDRLFYMNFGWDGSNDGWYACDHIPEWYNFVLGQRSVDRIAPEAWVRFVDAGGSGDGTPNDPWGSPSEAASEYPDGAHIIFKAGSYHNFTGSVTFDRPCVLKGYNSVIREL
jgi:hypothetical protein